MRIILIVLLIILLIVLILIFPFRGRFQGYVDPFTGIAVYSIKVLFIKLLLGRIKIGLNGFEIENKVNKIYSSDDSTAFDVEFNKQILKRIKIAKLNIIFNFGLISPNADALCCGSVYALASIISALVLNKNPYAQVFNAIKPEFNGKECELIVQMSIEINLIQILSSLIIAKKEAKKHVQKQK